MTIIGPIGGDRANVEYQWLETARTRAGWVDLYRASAREPYRLPLLAALQEAAPFGTALDLGCNCGALMPLIMAASPCCRVLGVDIAPVAIAAAKREWPAHDWACASIVDWLPTMVGHRRFDVATAGSALCAVAPADIDAVLDAVSALASRAIVLQEPTTTAMFGEGISPAGLPEWRYDFQRRLLARGWRLTSRVWQAMTTDRPGAVMAFRPDKEQT